MQDLCKNKLNPFCYRKLHTKLHTVQLDSLENSRDFFYTPLIYTLNACLELIVGFLSGLFEDEQN